MVLPYLYNQSFNYTVNIVVNPKGVAFISLFPFIFILLGIAPAIFFSIILGLKLSYRMKSLLFFLNAVFSVLVPFIINALIGYLSMLQYIYTAVLNDLNLYDTILSVVTLATSISQDIVYLSIGFVILNVIFMLYYIGLNMKERQSI
jgi:hypothetical protein